MNIGAHLYVVFVTYKARAMQVKGQGITSNYRPSEGKAEYTKYVLLEYVFIALHIYVFFGLFCPYIFLVMSWVVPDYESAEEARPALAGMCVHSI